jgi:hypothetical protein
MTVQIEPKSECKKCGKSNPCKTKRKEVQLDLEFNEHIEGIKNENALLKEEIERLNVIIDKLLNMYCVSDIYIGDDRVKALKRCRKIHEVEK